MEKPGVTQRDIGREDVLRELGRIDEIEAKDYYYIWTVYILSTNALNPEAA